jgi:hypothetical protein
MNFGGPMNTVPMPIRRPDFSTTVGTTEAQWCTENAELLWEWWQETEGEVTDLAGYRDFQSVQYDLEMDRDELMREVLAENQREDDAYEDYRGRLIDAELNGE